MYVRMYVLPHYMPHMHIRRVLQLAYRSMHEVSMALNDG